MQALYWTAILNGLLAPPILVLVMLVSGNKEIMGKRSNTVALAIAGWFTTLLMTVAAALLIWSAASGNK